MRWFLLKGFSQELFPKIEFSLSKWEGDHPTLLQLNNDLQKLVGSFKLQPIFKISVELDHSKNPSNHHLVTNI